MTTPKTASAAFLIAALASVTLGCAGRSANPAASAAAAQEARLDRGRVLVTVGGCHDCHTPMKFDPALGMPVPQMDRMLSGHPEGAPDPAGSLGPQDQAVVGPTFTSFRLPFGVVYTANLTPDRDTGLGSWTEEIFVRAVRTGRHFGGKGRPILPPMPWMNLASQSDEDLKAIFAYLRSVPAIRNGVPEPKVPAEVLEKIATGYDKILASAPSGISH